MNLRTRGGQKSEIFADVINGSPPSLTDLQRDVAKVPVPAHVVERVERLAAEVVVLPEQGGDGRHAGHLGVVVVVALAAATLSHSVAADAATYIMRG